MDNLVVFGIIVLSIVRVFGFLISVDFYVNLRKNRFFFLITGWFSWFLAGLFALIIPQTSDTFLIDLLFLFNGLFVTLGAFLIVLGITNIFWTFKTKQVILVLIFLVILPLISYLSGGNRLVGTVSSLILFFSYFIVMILDSLIGKNFKERVGNSYKWIIFLRVVVFLQIILMTFIILSGETFGLYDSTDDLLIILNYGMGIALSLVILILIIHLEHSVASYQKAFLKDTLTHDIGNILQIISSATEMLSVSEESQNKSDLILKKSKEASKLINEIKDL